MTIDPNDLAGTAIPTFTEDFNSLDLWNPTAGTGTWNTNYWWGAANGSTLTNNGEEQWYINHLYGPTSSVQPWTVSGGVLTLTANYASEEIQPLINNYQYTSGMIQTYYTFSQTYGYFEMRAKVPAGQGLWPAFWLLPVDGTWPPEIDVMEVLGHDPTTLHTFVHYKGRGGRHEATGASTKVADMSVDWHTYGVDWQVDYITWYFDGQQVYQTATPAGLNKPMYIIANLAVGGNWPGSPDADTQFPAQYQIDYIHVYKDAGVTDPPPEPTGGLFTLPTSDPWTYTVPGNRPGRGDTLVGTSGPDLLDGNAGETTPQIDMLKGGAGDDTYVVDRANDKVYESAGTDIDTVLSTSPKFTLPAEVENITLSGSSAQTAIGNALNNILKANNAGSTLSGGDGKDILIAGLGADNLTGGAGTDIFQFDLIPSSAGHITDFSSGDMLDFRALFGAAGYGGTDPVADGYIAFVGSAGSTQIYFDVDGSLGPESPKMITTLDSVSNPLTAQLDWFYV